MSDSLRKDLDRAKALRKLLERAMDRTPTGDSQESRKAAAATQLDDSVGPSWRGEADVPGLIVVEKSTRDAPPSRPAKARDQQRGARNDFFDGVRKALAGEDEDGSWVQDDSGQEDAPDAKPAHPHDVMSRVDELICQIQDLLASLPQD